MIGGEGVIFNNSVLLCLYVASFSTASRGEGGGCEGEINRRLENLAFWGTVSSETQQNLVPVLE